MATDLTLLPSRER